MLEELTTGLKNLEDRMTEYSEINSFLFNHNKIFMITTNGTYAKPEYNYQPFTFKYGDYDISEYLRQFTNK